MFAVMRDFLGERDTRCLKGAVCYGDFDVFTAQIKSKYRTLVKRELLIEH